MNYELESIIREVLKNRGHSLQLINEIINDICKAEEELHRIKMEE